ncbi:taste receptor type 2 member 4-like [Mantella aurantiaca]
MSLIDIVFLSIDVLQSLLSFYLNLYIVVFHTRSLRDGVKLNPPSLIQLAMGLTNISMRGMMIGSAVALWFPGYQVTRSYIIILIVVQSHLNFSYWLITWLCAYYCTILTNIRHQIFIWVKRSLVSFLPLLLFLSAVASFTLTVYSIHYFKIQIPKDNSTHYILPNLIYSVSDHTVVFLNFLCYCLPFLMTLASLVVTMSSLVRHIWKVKRNDSGFTPPNLQAHVSAVRTMASLLVLFVIVIVVEIVKPVAVSSSGQSVQLIIMVIVATFSLAEASIIIQSSPKLKKMFPPMICIQRTMEGHN